MKRKLSVIFAAALVLSLIITTAAFAQGSNITLKIDDPYMTVNGVKQEVDPGRGTKPVIVQGRTLLPIRAIIENMDGIIFWNGAKQQVSIVLGNDKIDITIGQNKAYVNGNAKTLDVPAKIINGRTMLPIRFIGENLGAKVDWENSTRTVAINFPGKKITSETKAIMTAADTFLAANTAKTISAADIYNKVVVGGDKSYFLVSLQSPEDYAKGHVKGAINIPFKQIAKKENLAKLPKDKKIVLICYTGHTASYASMFLNEIGYNAMSMKFGMTGWNDASAGMGTVKPYTKSAGYPVDTTPVTAPANNTIPEVKTGQSTVEDIIIAATDAFLSSGKPATVSAEEIYTKVIQGGDQSYFLLSIQNPEDYAKGHVKGAINIPFNDIAKEENLKKLPKDKKIVVICYTGHTASYTAMFLNQLGYDATVLKFGTMGWNDTTAGMGSAKPYTKSAGYPVVEGVNP